MIRKDLLDFQYYLNRLSMFMKESYGIAEQNEIFYRQLYQVNTQFDKFFKNLDIWGNDEIPSEALDLIGSIFGCYRNFTIKLNDSYVQIDLDDNDFILYIKCQIVKQNFKGTNEELIKLYTTYNKEGLLKLQFDYILLATVGSLNCRIYFSNFNDFSSNIQNLFDAGYLTIESMGINYDREKLNISSIATFAPDDLLTEYDYYKFDKGVFA